MKSDLGSPGRHAPTVTADESADAGEARPVVVKRGTPTVLAETIGPVARWLAIAIIAGVLGLAVGALVLLLGGDSPTAALSVAWEGAAGDWLKLGVTANRAAPFLLAALGFIIAYKAGLLNIGAEGQIFVGGAASGAVALSIGHGLTSYLAVPVALLAAGIAGGLLSLIAGALYVWRRVSIVLSTLLLNFVAIQLVSYLVRRPFLLQESPTISEGPSFEGTARRFPQSDQIPENFRLARIGEVNRAHIGIILAVASAILVAIVLRRTALGFRLRALGSGRAAAEHSGVDSTTNVLLAMFLAGVFGGLAGASLVMGDRFLVLETISEGFGFIAILAALLARASPLGAIVAALFFAILQRGGQVMEASGEAPQATVLIIQGFIVIFIAAGFELERRWRSARAKAKV